MVAAVLRKYITRATVIVALCVTAAAAVIAGILLSSRPIDDQKVTVTIEIRAQKRALIKVDGNPIGFAPRGLTLPLSSNPITIEAAFPHGRTTTKTVIPDHNQLVDM
jgi:hypothetical protein